MLKLLFYTQGCRVNQTETACLKTQAKNSSFLVTNHICRADVAIINTCTVTEKSDRDLRLLTNRLARENPDIQIALIGCQSEIKKEQLLNLKNVRWVIGNQNKSQVLDIVIADFQSKLSPRVHIAAIEKLTFSYESASIETDRTRATIKIQDGCDQYCSYCIVPYARGPARSRKFDNILDEVESLCDAGFKEVVVTGINLGEYKEGHHDLKDVLNSLSANPRIERIRISSLEPQSITQEFLEMIVNKKKICRFFHLPVQSGSDAILAAMDRPYTISDFKKIVLKIHQLFPQACLGTDVIVGFPGETEELFQETLRTFTELPLSYFHVFSYSDRDITKSAKFNDKVPSPIIKNRSKQLRSLSQEKRYTWMESLVGSKTKVLVEQKKHGQWTGLTDNYVRVDLKTDSKQSLVNQLVEVQLDKVVNDRMQAHILK